MGEWAMLDGCRVDGWAIDGYMGWVGKWGCRGWVRIPG